MYHLFLYGTYKSDVVACQPMRNELSTRFPANFALFSSHYSKSLALFIVKNPSVWFGSILKLFVQYTKIHLNFYLKSLLMYVNNPLSLSSSVCIKTFVFKSAKQHIQLGIGKTETASGSS